MADSKLMAKKPGLLVLEESPASFGEVLCKLRVCHDLCRYSDVKILGREVETKIEQCSVDFRHVSTQTSTLAERVASSWCATCIIFFENLENIKGDPSKILNRISTQARELSRGFHEIGQWIGQLAGRFHDATELTEKDKNIYMTKVENALKDAERKQREADKARKRAEEERQSRQDTADKWGIAAMIPIVNLVAIPGCLIAQSYADSAEAQEKKAKEELSAALKIVREAKSDSDKAEAAAKNIEELVTRLKQVEEICEAQAAFWNYQADKFGSLPSKIESAETFIELGLVGQSVVDIITYLKERQGELEKYHLAMTRINNSFNISTRLRPSQFPAIQLPTLDITLE